MDSKKTGIVNLENLPETDWIYFNKKNILKTILDLILQMHFDKVKNKCKELSKLTGFSYYFISKLYLSSRYKIKISHLKFLLSFLPTKKRKIFFHTFEKSIIRIGYQKSINKPVLPINFNSKGGFKFLADLFTDGSLNSNLQVTYTNSNPDFILDNLNSTHILLTNKQLKFSSEEYNKIITLKHNELESYIKTILSKKSLVRISFDSKEKIFKGKKTFVYQITYPTFLGKILYYSLCIPKGKRIYTNPELPEFIFKNKPLLKFFMGRIFSNEGHTTSHGCGVTHSIDVTPHIQNMNSNLKEFLSQNKTFLAPKLLWNYKKIFYILNCKNPSDPYVANLYTTSKKEIHAKWQIYVGGEDVALLLKRVDFDNSFKIKIERYLNSVHIFRKSREVRINQLLKLGKNIQNKKGHFTVNDLYNKINLEKSGINRNVKIAREKGLLSICSYQSNAYCYMVET